MSEDLKKEAEEVATEVVKEVGIIAKLLKRGGRIITKFLIGEGRISFNHYTVTALFAIGAAFFTLYMYRHAEYQVQVVELMHKYFLKLSLYFVALTGYGYIANGRKFHTFETIGSTAASIGMFMAGVAIGAGLILSN